MSSISGDWLLIRLLRIRLNLKPITHAMKSIGNTIKINKKLSSLPIPLLSFSSVGFVEDKIVVDARCVVEDVMCEIVGPSEVKVEVALIRVDDSAFLDVVLLKDTGVVTEVILPPCVEMPWGI